MTIGSTLPPGFEALEPYVSTWALDSASARADMRGQAPAEERKAFYDTASELLEAALDYLDSKPLSSFDEGEKRLMFLMLSLAHVALAEEVHGAEEARHAEFRSFMPVKRAPADF